MDKERIVAFVVVSLMVALSPFLVGFGLVFLGEMFIKGTEVAAAIFSS